MRFKMYHMRDACCSSYGTCACITYDQCMHRMRDVSCIACGTHKVSHTIHIYVSYAIPEPPHTVHTWYLHVYDIYMYRMCYR